MPQYRFAVQASEDPNVIDQETEKTSRVKKFGRLRRHKMSIDQAPPFRFSSQYYEIRRDTFASLFEFLGSEEHDGRNRSELVTLITSHANLSLVSKSFSISIDELQILTDDILNDLVGFGPLEELLRQDEITDIMVVGPNFIYFEINGEIDRANLKFENESHLRSICQRIARRVGRRIDESAPMCDARLPDGSRVNIVVPPLAIDGTNLTIRKFQADRISFSGLIEKGALNDEVVALLSEFVKIRCNILVVGGTGSGKTTLLNCLNQGLSSRERIVTCEDAAELQLQ